MVKSLLPPLNEDHAVAIPSTHGKWTVDENSILGRIANGLKDITIEQKVEELKEKHPSIGDFRNTGLLGCIELVKNRKTKEPITPWNASPELMEPTNRMAAKVREVSPNCTILVSKSDLIVVQRSMVEEIEVKGEIFYTILENHVFGVLEGK